MTKGVLYKYHNQIQGWIEAGDFIVYALEPMIEKFYDKYQKQVESLYEQINALQREHLQFNEDVVVNDRAGNAMFLPGKTNEMLQVAWRELMTQEVLETTAGKKILMPGKKEPGKLIKM